MNKGFVYGAITMLLMLVSIFTLLPQQMDAVDYNKNIFSETKIRLTNYELIMQEIMFDSNWTNPNITTYFDGNSEEIFNILNDNIISCENNNTSKLDVNTIITTIDCNLIFKTDNKTIIDGNISKNVKFYNS